jgi:hypothetical protein
MDGCNAIKEALENRGRDLWWLQWWQMQSLSPINLTLRLESETIRYGIR